MKKKQYKTSPINSGIRIIKYLLYLYLILIGVLPSFAQEPPSADTDYEDHTPASYTIAVASDLHIDPENHYAGMVNPLVMYNMELIDALLWDVLEQKADILLICGDISNSGRAGQHEALVEKLKRTKEKGLPIYVLPGNHDIRENETEQFAELYAEFGYQDAYSRDEDSLSYSLVLNDFMLLMLDTDGYSKRTNGAYVSDTTRAWIQTQLELAKTNHWQVLTAGHYPILTEQITELFHLVPRIFAAVNPSGDYHVSLGFGKLVTSITMTIFYLILYFVYSMRYQYENNTLKMSMILLSIIRIALCLFPQNDWTGEAPIIWGVYRNIPFVIIGLIMVVLYYKKKNDKAFHWMWLAITLSFLFYLPVVLWSDAHPMIGMLMLPKTCMYIWMVVMGYRLVK